MSRSNISTNSVGNDFLVKDQTNKTDREITKRRVITIPISVIDMSDGLASVIPVQHVRTTSFSIPRFTNRHKLIILAILTVIAVVVTSTITAPYWYGRLLDKSGSAAIVGSGSAKNNKPPKAFAVPANPLYAAYPSTKQSQKILAITSQTGTVVVGTNTVPVSSSVINSWLSVTYNKDKSVTYIKVNPALVTAGIQGIVNQYVIPVNNTIQATENGVLTTIYTGSDGTAITNPNLLSSQIQTVIDGLMDGKGFNINVALTTVPAQTVSVATLGKVLDANVTTKRMYAFDNGQLVNTFLVTAGKPTTPTPLGEFHIWEKLPEQTMTGYNPDGSKYIQPDVQWINYFDHSGDAVHGNYWRPTSYFGNINSSHGCVGLQDSDAEWVYDWAPIGTTVITHA